MNAEPTINCPNCKTPIPLTESLAAPLVDAVRRDYEKRIADSAAEFAQKAEAVRLREEALARERAQLDQKIAARLDEERAKLIAEESRKLRLALGSELKQKADALAELETILKDKDAKLAAAAEKQAEFLRKQRQLDEERAAMTLTIETKVNEGITAAREKAKREAEEALKATIAERDVKLAQMAAQIEDLKRKAEQGSQQIQGDALELELEALLAAKFPTDSITRVAKGEHGGDVLQRVNGPLGSPCGAILWESKRTKNWSDGWLAKLKDDQRAARAELCAIISQALPKDCDHFTLVEGVWIAHPRCAYPLALALRQTLVEAASARQASLGQETKMGLIYEYITGSRFRQRVEALADVFQSMQEDLDKERKAIVKQWEKRRIQIERMLNATVGMWGDLQGIAGQSLQEIESFELDALENSSA